MKTGSSASAAVLRKSSSRGEQLAQALVPGDRDADGDADDHREPEADRRAGQARREVLLELAGPHEVPQRLEHDVQRREEDRPARLEEVLGTELPQQEEGHDGGRAPDARAADAGGPSCR